MMIGEISQSNLYLLLPSKVSQLATMMQRHDHMTLTEALRKIYQSDVYSRLEDEETKMWHLGPVALYEDMTKGAPTD